MATTATSASGKLVHVVQVGASGLTFTPNAITAAVGDIVEFQFYPQSHSVAQSTFAAPCMPLNSSSFFSGPVPSTSGMATKTFQLEINNTTPIWFYCATGTHCESGMAGVINQAATGANTIEAYITAAKNSSTKVPTTVQGGALANSLVANSTSSSSGTSTSSAANSTSTKSAGVEARGSAGWMSVGFAGALAVAVGSLMA
jgi:plastocyanin